MFSSSYFASSYFGEHFKSFSSEPIVRPFFVHIWPADKLYLDVASIATKFYILGVPSKVEILHKSTVFWTDRVNRAMFIRSNKQ